MKNRMLSIILALAIFFSISAPAAMATDEKIKECPITLSLGNTKILSPDESIVIENEDGIWTPIPVQS